MSFIKKTIFFSFVRKLIFKKSGIFLKYLSRFSQNKDAELLTELQNKVAQKTKIRVGFYVIYESMFQTKPLYEEMLNDENFDPFILIIPDILRGDANMFEQMKMAVSDFSSQYDSVLSSYDHEKNDFIDYSNKVDIVFFNNPYDHMTHPFYRSSHIRRKKLYAHVNYAYLGRTHYELFIVKRKFYYFAWKIFTESKRTAQELRKFGYNGNNLEITGYCKMDQLSKIECDNRKRKRIIISPHHTIYEWKSGLNLSNFLRFSDFFLELPRLYPDVEFIFRPHPMLFMKLKNHPNWTETKVKEYIEKFTSYSNTKYDTSEDYLSYFANSDAMIHDCGSFLAEYLYTSKPQCYMLNSDDLDAEFLEFGKDMLNQCYKAFTEQDLIDFIETVVMQENDVMKKQRENFSKEEIMYNYTDATKSIIEVIRKSIKIS